MLPRTQRSQLAKQRYTAGRVARGRRQGFEHELAPKSDPKRSDPPRDSSVERATDAAARATDDVQEMLPFVGDSSR